MKDVERIEPSVELPFAAACTGGNLQSGKQEIARVVFGRTVERIDTSVRFFLSKH